MIVRTKFNTDLNQIAKDIGITANFSYVGHARNGQNRYSGVLFPLSDKFRRLGFYETAKGNRSRINAVCAHGHYAFMKAVFEKDPEATIESSWTRSVGQKVTVDNLDRMNIESENRNIGSIMNPAYYGELCICSGSYSVAPIREKKKVNSDDFNPVTSDFTPNFEARKEPEE